MCFSIGKSKKASNCFTHHFLKFGLLLVLIGIMSFGCGSGGGGGDNGILSTGEPDLESPTVPGGLTAAQGSDSEISLSWNASSDNVGIAGYKIYRYGTYIKSVRVVSTSDTGLDSKSQYCYRVSAYDAAGNESEQSGHACNATD